MKTGHSKWALTESFWGWVKRAELGGKGAVTTAQLETVRQRILMALLRGGVSGHSRTIQRVIEAPKLLDLWYLRSEVMGTLSHQQGEAVASRMMAEISRFFTGLLPPGLAKACFFVARTDTSGTSNNSGNAARMPIRAAPSESILQVAMEHVARKALAIKQSQTVDWYS